MKNIFDPLDLSVFPEIDKVARKDDIIHARKFLNNIIKDSRTQSKLNECYYCGTHCDSFCNSHTLPAFCLKNIASKGKIYYSNTILDLPILNEDKGINEAGTFHLICRDCDSKIFQSYENPESYDEIPSTKMLAQIDMKNNLKNISKRLIELEMYDLMNERIGIGDGFANAKKSVGDLDLKEFKDSYKKAKKRDLKPFQGDYYVGIYHKLPYVVPVAFQGTIALISDLDGDIINNIYNHDSKYVIRNISLCIFPLKTYSIVMLFVDKDNRRYGRFFKQLKKFNTEERLSVINYILFSYSEDYFLSPDIPKEVLNNLRTLSGKTPELLAFSPTTNSQQLEESKKIFNYNDRFSIPNLLLNKFAIQTED